MGVIARGTKRSYIGIFTIAGIGVLLYFLPELSKVGRIFSHNKPKVENSVENVSNSESNLTTVEAEKTKKNIPSNTVKEKKYENIALEEVTSEAQQSNSKAALGDPLTRVLRKIDSGAFDQNQDTKKVSPEIIKGDDRSITGLIVKSPKISWELLSRREVTNVVKSALKSAIDFQRTVAPNKEKSKAAIGQYVNGLNNFLRGDLKKLEPKVALDYLGKLDIDVSKSLRQENASRSLFKRWAKAATLGPIVESSGANTIRTELMPAYLAKVTLTKISIRESTLSKKDKKLRINPDFNIDVQGVVYGEDALSLEIYRNGELISTAKLNKSGKGAIVRKFRFNYRGRGILAGLYRIRAVDADGLFIDKVYKLFPNVRRFRLRNGKYEFPEIFVDVTKQPSQSLDKYFYAGSSSTSGGYNNSNTIVESNLKEAPLEYRAF